MSYLKESVQKKGNQLNVFFCRVLNLTRRSYRQTLNFFSNSKQIFLPRSALIEQCFLVKKTKRFILRNDAFLCKSNGNKKYLYKFCKLSTCDRMQTQFVVPCPPPLTHPPKHTHTTTPTHTHTPTLTHTQ